MILSPVSSETNRCCWCIPQLSKSFVQTCWDPVAGNIFRRRILTAMRLYIRICWMHKPTTCFTTSQLSQNLGWMIQSCAKTNKKKTSWQCEAAVEDDSCNTLMIFDGRSAWGYIRWVHMHTGILLLHLILAWCYLVHRMNITKLGCWRLYMHCLILNCLIDLLSGQKKTTKHHISLLSQVNNIHKPSFSEVTISQQGKRRTSQTVISV